jgi:hypothetical protein
MTKQEFWNAYFAMNPKFADENAKITLTGRGLKKLFEKTYYKDYEKGKNVGAFNSPTSSTSSDPFGLFRRF